MPFPLPDVPPLRGPQLATARRWLDVAADAARDATCLRSACGTAIVAASGELLSVGSNSLPGGAAPQVCRKDCGLAASFKSDRTCCTHAEVRAIVQGLREHGDLTDATLYFARLGQDGHRKPSGRPYCTICSKLTVEAGIALFVLEHDFGVVAYPSGLYNDLSFSYGHP